MRVSIIGMGAMGRNHYRVLSSLADVRVVAVCDSVGDPGVPEPLFREVTQLLDEAQPDAVVVAVPTTEHLKVASQVIRRRIPLLIEKPVASTPEEAEELIALAAGHDARVAVGHVERFNPVVRSLIDQLAGKEIYSINITRIGPFPPRINDVGVLVDLSVHDIDLVHCITNTDAVIEARVYKSTKRIGGREDNAVVTMRLEHDVVANITTNWLTPFKKRTIEVATSEAFYTADLMSQELTEYSDYTEDNSFLVRKCPVKKGEPLSGELQAFLTFARTGDRDGLASLEDGLRTLTTIYRHRCEESPSEFGDSETVARRTATS